MNDPAEPKIQVVDSKPTSPAKKYATTWAIFFLMLVLAVAVFSIASLPERGHKKIASPTSNTVTSTTTVTSP